MAETVRTLKVKVHVTPSGVAWKVKVIIAISRMLGVGVRFDASRETKGKE